MTILMWLLWAMPLAAQTGTPASPETGKALFIGKVRFANGGPACASCHNAAGIGFPGGGSMGPNLTGVYAKFGPDGLNSSLETLYFPAMTPIYTYRPLTQDERRNLFAFFQSLSRKREESSTPAVIGLSLAGLAILLAATAVAGRHRLKPVRRRLVERARLEAGRRA
ncbi:MAG: c-type cytochrome [Bryobacterales bacterium]|nr:c-type cytochrome [Bryobacterales bacterium]